VKRVSGVYHVVHCPEDFINWHPSVQPVDLVKINILHFEAFQRSPNGVRNVFSRESERIWPRILCVKSCQRKMNFGCYDEFFSTVFGKKVSSNLFRNSLRISISSVKKVYAMVNCFLDNGSRVFFAQMPFCRSKTHHPQAIPRDQCLDGS